MNLDADNLIDTAITEINEEFHQQIHALHLWSGRFGDGTYGRIAIDAARYAEAGGYDESFLPMGYQDMDILDRLRGLGCVIKHRPCKTGTAIQNTADESIEHCRIQHMSWEDFNRANQQASHANIARGCLKANIGGCWGEGIVEIVLHSSVPFLPMRG